MAVDLSGAFHARYEQELENARKAERAGDRERAAGLYRKAARSLLKIAPSIRNAQVRRDMAARAEDMMRKADELEAGEVSRARSPGPRSGGAGEREKEDDPVREAVLAMISKSSVQWDDIAGLEEVKGRIRSEYAMSFARTDDGVELPKAGNLLLFGPPGTGKTMLAAAVCGQLGATFFSAKFSSLLSKWFGESSKIVGGLYRVAREKTPSVVFLDDFEALVQSRDGDSSGAERRVLGEILVSLDGLESKEAPGFVLTIAATNKPWLIDDAALSRFPLRVHVGLPDGKAREALLAVHLTGKGYRLSSPPGDMAQAVEGYSGREIEALARIMITDMLRETNPDLERASGGKEAEKLRLRTRPLGLADLDRATKAIKPSTTPEAVARYGDWTRRYGAGV